MARAGMEAAAASEAEAAVRGGGHGMAMSDEKARNFKGTMRRLLAYLGSYKIAIIAVLIISLASTLFSILGPKILGTATTKLFEGAMAMASGKGGIDFGAIGRIVLITLGLYVLSAAFTYVQGWIMAGISTKISYRLRKDISEKMDRLPLRYFDGTTHGELLSRITNDVDVINQTLSQSLMQLISSAVTVVGVVAMMLSISWILTLVALVIMPISLLFVTGLVKKSQKLFKEQQAYLGQVNGHVEEMYGGHLVIKAFNAEKRSIAAFEGLQRQALRGGLVLAVHLGRHHAHDELHQQHGLRGHLRCRGQPRARKASTWATSRPSSSTRGSSPSRSRRPRTSPTSCSRPSPRRSASSSSSRRTRRPDESEAPSKWKSRRAGGVQQRALRLHAKKRYHEDMSIQAEQGQTIAIVGPTGAGKTTLVNLLMRFYEV